MSREHDDVLAASAAAVRRAGPPTPRNAPPQTHGEKALTFGNSDLYDARNDAWKAYHAAQCANWTPVAEHHEKDGFFAGWEACQQAIAKQKA